MIFIGLVLTSLIGGGVCSSIQRAVYGEPAGGDALENDKGVETSSGVMDPAAAPASDGLRLVRRPDQIFDLLMDPLESMLGVLDNNKPKMKTVLSLTEVVDPKRWQERRSASGKDALMPPDPFFFDQWFPFKPPSFDHPRLIVERNVTGDEPSLANLDLSRSLQRLDSKRIKRHGDSNTDGDAAQPLSDCSLEFDLNKAEQGAAAASAEGRGCADVLLTSLPFVEGALGGIFLVLLVLLMASLRGKKPNAIWTRVPFVDKSQYTEKV